MFFPVRKYNVSIDRYIRRASIRLDPDSDSSYFNFGIQLKEHFVEWIFGVKCNCPANLVANKDSVALIFFNGTNSASVCLFLSFSQHNYGTD